MFSTLRRDLDPLDLEILERAFEGALIALKKNIAVGDLDSDEALEAALRRELIEIALFNGVSDPETLRDVLLAAMSKWITEGSPVNSGLHALPRPFLADKCERT